MTMKGKNKRITRYDDDDGITSCMYHAYKSIQRWHLHQHSCQTR